MKGLIALFLMLLLALPATAVDNGQVKYLGGTASGMKTGVIGGLDTTSDTALTFESTGSRVAISYSSIDSFEHSSPVARHLGVLPAIFVGLLRARQHRHIFRITYQDQNAVSQVVVFEVPKQMPHTLQAVLNAHAPHTDRSCEPCSASNSF